MVSGVSHLMKQIDDECQAMNNGLSGLASVARHSILQARFKALDRYRDELAQHIGHEAATLNVCILYNSAMEAQDVTL